MTHKEFFEGELGWRLTTLSEFMAPCVTGETGRLYWYIQLDRCEELLGLPLEELPLVLARSHGERTPYWWDTSGTLPAKRMELGV